MKTKTRIGLAIITVFMLLAIIPVLSAVSASAASSEDFSYDLDNKGCARLTSYNSSSPTVTIPSILDGHTVKAISAETFADNPDITHIFIPETVREIGVNTFADCKKLTIFCPGGSYAHIFADKNKIPFKILNHGEVAMISLDNKDTSLAVGSKLQIKTSLFPDYGNGKPLYSSSSGTVASVNKGIVTARKKGQTTIIVKYKKLSEKFRVNVYIPVKKVTAVDSLTLGAGESGYIKNYSVQPSNADRSRLKIVSSDESVAVYKQGKVCTFAPGKAYLGIWYNGKKLAYVNVTVKKAPQKISLTPSSIEAAKGEVIPISSYVNNGSFAVNREYSSSNSKVARVERKGWNVNIRAVSEGTAEITVKTYNGKKAVCTVKVKQAAKNIRFKNKEITIGLGERCKVTSIPIGGAQYYRTYYSWNPKKAAIDKNGYVTGKKIGKTTVAVKLPNGKTGTCIVNVKAAPKRIHLGRNKLTIELGESYCIRSWLDENEASAGRKYSVTNNGVLELDKNNWNGKVTGKKIGTSEIRVTSYNGKTDVCKVTVVKESDRKKVADAGISWHRYTEADGSYMEIFDTYNNGRIPGTYYMRGLDPWCATFVSAVFMKAGKADLIYPSCSCPMMVLGARNMGIWVEDDAYIPERGDIIVYNWEDDGIGDCDYGAYHVGVVVDVNSGTMTMIEGNRDDNDKNGDDFVEYRKIPPNDKFIRGFITPKYKT